jgi:hypothetical protein
VGGISQFVAFPEQPWISRALFYLAIVITLLATLGLAHAIGLLGSVATRMRRSRLARTGTQPADDKTSRNAAVRTQVPRPAAEECARRRTGSGARPKPAKLDRCGVTSSEAPCGLMGAALDAITLD